MRKFISGFASDIESMQCYREALGFSKLSYESSLLNFDYYAASHYPETVTLNREVVIGWINEQVEKSNNGIANKTTAIRMFGKYLSAIGKEAYILPDEYVIQPSKTFTPYIFTDDELTRLFHATDCMPKNLSYPLASKIPPVLFRLIYTCGLRPNEGRELLQKNINFKNGEIFITKTKRKKERIVVMSDDMLVLCKKYNSVRESLGVSNEYFFPQHGGRVYTASQLERLLMKCWAQANPTVLASKLPNIRVYDLRHRFASAVLNRWLDEKQNLYNKLPYLRAYMGHDKISETAYYIHILPENIIKSSGIDWEVFESLVPRVREEAILCQE